MWLRFLNNKQYAVRELNDPYSVSCVLESHFIAGTSEFLILSSGAGAFVSTGVTNIINVEGNEPGICQGTTGTSNVGRTYIGTYLNTIRNGFGKNIFTTKIRLPTLSTSVESFDIRLGFVNSISSDSSNGVYLRYSHSLNTGSWQLVYRNNSIEQLINTNILVNANEWSLITIENDITTSSISINNVIVGGFDISGLNQTSKAYGAGISIIKTVGATARTFQCDYLKVSVNS